MWLCNFTEILLQHGCSPANFWHIFRTPFLKNTSGWLRYSEPATKGNLSIKPFFKILQNSWNIPVPKVCNFINKETTQMFSFEFCGLFKNILFTEYLRAASEHWKSLKTFLVAPSMNISDIFLTLRENCPNTELFLVRIQKNTGQK